MNLAKQSTAKTFLVGPILDSTGGAKTDEAIGSIKVTKNGTVGAADAQDTLTHDHTGHYKLVADGGDFDTLGEVEFSLNSGTNAMQPVKFQVVTANVYDSLCSTDVLDVNVDQILGTAPTETGAGYLAGAFTKFFDKQTPTGTVNSLPDAVAGAESGLPVLATVDGTLTVPANAAKLGSKGVTVDAGGTTFPASIHASGAAVAKSPATLDAGDVTGNLPADVKAYTAQPTVTGATLDGDYDAAKTAAQPGDEMDLVDAPNATALAAILAAFGDGSTLTALITADICTYVVCVTEKRSAATPADVYVVVPYKNLVEVAHGDATSPTITVTDSEGNVIINAATLIEIGITGRYAYTSTVLRVPGKTYTVDVSMTIDGSPRAGQAMVVGRNY